jgi:hypothetical protein
MAEIPFPDAARMPALLSHVRERRCALFVGAGLSRPAGYPGWLGLMDATVAATVAGLGDDGGNTVAELGRLLDAGRYAEVADQCRHLLGRQRFWEFLRSQLSGPAEPPEATHRAIVRSPYACVVTTNFDTLIEDAFARWSPAGIPKAPTGMQLGEHGTLLVDGAFFVLKAHGTIHDEPSLVFTSEDYRRMIHANPAFQAMMAAILLSHALLFVGYSLNDPNFRLLIESQLSIFGKDAPPRYALMEGVGRTEAEILRRTAGIEVIPYPAGRHEVVASFLGTIADVTAPPVGGHPGLVRLDPVPPARPVLSVVLRPHHALLEVIWFETTTRDLPGVTVPLERRWMSTVGPVPWGGLAEVSGASGSGGIRGAGRLLGALFGKLPIPWASTDPGRTVVLDVPVELAGLPWEWMEVGGQPLCLVAPVCRRVSGLSDSSRGRPIAQSPLRVLLVGDTLAKAERPHALPETREEVEAIRDCFEADSAGHRVTVLTGSNACYHRVLEAIGTGGHDIVHVAGVAYVDDSGESVLPLHDGHVRASEVATLLIRRPPSLVFLDADTSGFVPAFGGWRPMALGPGGGFSDFYARLARHRAGFERVVSRAGVGTFIGCMAEAAARTARDLSTAFYRHLLAGMPVAQALFEARRKVASGGEDTALLYAMAGYPDTVLVPAPGNAGRGTVEDRRRGSESGGQGGSDAPRPEPARGRNRAGGSAGRGRREGRRVR